MTLTSIAIFIVGAILYGFVLPARWRGWALLIGSVLAVYWLQPAIPVRPLDFILPTATLTLGIAGWLITRQDVAENTARTIDRDSTVSMGIVVILVVLLAVLGGLITASPPPNVLDVLFSLAAMAAVLISLGV